MIKLNIESIAPGNNAITFIAKRVQDDDYRGVISSQHNRYTLDQVINILSKISKYAPSFSLLRIRTTDLSKRPTNLPEEISYALMCEEIKREVGIGTQDALRKNLFVDFHRMNLINRYTKNKTAIEPFEHQSVFYVSLSELGDKLINATPQEQHFIFSNAINNFLPGYIDTIIDLLRSEDPSINQISFQEFMYFVSAVNSDTSFSISISDCRKLIINYRLLSPVQKKAIDNELQEKLDPSSFSGDKRSKRDFHNWKNKADQMFMVLSQSIYFDKNTNGDLILSQKKELFGSGRKLNRSYTEKQNYFKNHKVKKVIGFELHHIIALATSNSLPEFKAYDNWKNMLYIDGKKHSELSQSNNKHIYLYANNKDFLLSKDPSIESQKTGILLIFNRNVLYNLDNQKCLIKYNQELIKGN